MFMFCFVDVLACPPLFGDSIFNIKVIFTAISDQRFLASGTFSVQRFLWILSVSIFVL